MNWKATFLKIIYTLLGVLCLSQAQAQLTTNTAVNADQLAATIAGAGVTVYGATLVCGPNAKAKFYSNATCLPLDSGILLTTGKATDIGSPASVFNSASTGTGGDAQLNALAGVSTQDKCVLEFNFVPKGDTVKFEYVFASEEYPTFACTSFNDVFGFFISGPGITGSPNIALLPGGTTPVTINNVNDKPCGAAYASYYVNSASCANFVYNGRTTVLTAQAVVAPCDTYHLKLAIADVGDSSYDSGVFIKAGSLSSPTPTVGTDGGIEGPGGTISDTTQVLRGCVDGEFKFNIPAAYPFPIIIHYTITGDAVNGVDYTWIPDTVIIAPGATSATVPVTPLLSAGSAPVEYVTVTIDSLSGGGYCGTGISDTSGGGTATIAILDTVSLQILTPDTAVCVGSCVDIMVVPDPLDGFYEFYWTSSDNPNVILGTEKNFTACPDGHTTTYTLHAYFPLPGGGSCDTFSRDITISIAPFADVYAGPNDTTCLGVPVTLMGYAQPDTATFSYLWSGADGISPTDNNIATFTPPGIGTFVLILEATPTGPAACYGSDTVEIFVLPDDFTLETTDTTICLGNCVQVQANGHDMFTYLWTPTTGISNPTSITPMICPPQPDTTTYTLTASYPNCPDIVKSFTLTTEPQPAIEVGADLEKCQWDTLHLHAVVTPADYNAYTYLWSPDTFLNTTTLPDVIFSGDSSRWVKATVTTPNGCTASDSLYITTHLGNFGTLAPQGDTGICIGERVDMLAGGGVFYEWSPPHFLSDTLGAAVTATPTADISYAVLVTDQYGCKDTLTLNIDVYPGAVLDLGDSIHLYPGDSVVMNPQGNALYFSWFPHLGLSNPNIANPVAMPSVNTRYFVDATTERGCATRDSVDVIVHLDSELDVPNAFVPGSGPNGTLKAVHLGLAELKYLRIFNRWGEKVFETKDINAGWDGTVGGKPQPMGVYIYTVEGKTYRGKEVKKQGNITLIR